MDLVVEDNSRVGTMYFLMSEDNVRREVQLPWVSFGSDAASIAAEGLFLNEHPHPRTYGNFARLLGHYVRDEGLVPLAEAIRRLTSLPAANLGIARRGALAARLLCRSRHLRSPHDRRPGDLRGAARLCGRHAPRLRQRRAGAARRRADRRDAGPGRARPRLAALPLGTDQSQLATDPKAGVPVERQGPALGGKESRVESRRAYLNAVAGVVPEHDVHQLFIDWAAGQVEDPRLRKLFLRMAERSGIDHRWSVLEPAPGGLPHNHPGGFYHGAMPATSTRMQRYAAEAPELALRAIERLREQVPLDGITHLVVASCTGFVAPGIDQIIARRLGLDGVERTLVGFMGCYAAVCALRTA